MKYLNCEIEKCNNGYLIIQRNEKYVFDNFIEMIIILAQQYDELDISSKMIEYCKQEAEKED